MGMASPRTTKQTESKMKIKPNKTKCSIWIGCIAFLALGTIVTVHMMPNTAYAVPPQDNIGTAYISSVVGVNGACPAVNTPTGNTGHKWDVQAGGTYYVTLSGATDCDQGLDSSIDVIVHNGCGENIDVVANQVNNTPGLYQFVVTIPQEACGCTMPIEYCTTNSSGVAAFQEGSGTKAQGFDGTGGDTKVGHLRISTFDGNCVLSDPLCPGSSATPTPTPCTGSITACKFYDFNANGVKDPSEQLLAWPFCLTSASDSSISPVSQSSSNGSCATFSNLPLGTYAVTEGSAPGFTSTTIVSNIMIDHCDQNPEVDFGNYCTVPSGGLTLGFWSNKNGNKLITSDGATTGTGRNLKQGVVDLLNGCSLRNANGQVHTFVATSGYTDFRNWLLGATATNMAYMLSAQLAALKLDTSSFAVPPNKVDGGAFDLCSNETVNQLITDACNLLSSPTCGSTCNPPSGSALRIAQENRKNCIDAINNNGPVVPVTPCDHSGASAPCGQ
jgi:hypothetical protein